MAGLVRKREVRPVAAGKGRDMQLPQCVNWPKTRESCEFLQTCCFFDLAHRSVESYCGDNAWRDDCHSTESQLRDGSTESSSNRQQRLLFGVVLIPSLALHGICHAVEADGTSYDG
jgi:hypothetical protein